MKDTTDHAKVIRNVRNLKAGIDPIVLKSAKARYAEDLQTMKLPSYRRVFSKLLPAVYDSVFDYAREVYPDSNHIRACFVNDVFLYLLGQRKFRQCDCGQKFLGGGEYCSLSCSSKFATQTDSVKKARKATCRRKYGHDNPAKSNLIRRKSKATIAKRTSLDQDHINAKREKTVQRKYGVANVMHLDETKDAVRDGFVKSSGSWDDHVAKKQAKTYETNQQNWLK